MQSVQKFDNAPWNLHTMQDHKGQKVKIPTGAKSAGGCQSEVKNGLFFGKKSQILTGIPRVSQPNAAHRIFPIQTVHGSFGAPTHP